MSEQSFFFEKKNFFFCSFILYQESLGDYQASRVNQLNVIMKSLSLITDLVLCGDFNFDADSAGSIESKAISKGLSRLFISYFPFFFFLFFSWCLKFFETKKKKKKSMLMSCPKFRLLE